MFITRGITFNAESQGLGHNVTTCSMDFSCTWPRWFSRLWRGGATPALQPPARGLSQRVLRRALFVHNVRLTHWRAGSKSSRSGGCGGAAQDGSSRQAGAPRTAKHALSVLDAATIVPTCAGACGRCASCTPRATSTNPSCGGRAGTTTATCRASTRPAGRGTCRRGSTRCLRDLSVSGVPPHGGTVSQKPELLWFSGS